MLEQRIGVRDEMRRPPIELFVLRLHAVAEPFDVSNALDRPVTEDREAGRQRCRSLTDHRQGHAEAVTLDVERKPQPLGSQRRRRQPTPGRQVEPQLGNHRASQPGGGIAGGEVAGGPPPPPPRGPPPPPLPPGGHPAQTRGPPAPGRGFAGTRLGRAPGPPLPVAPAPPPPA